MLNSTDRNYFLLTKRETICYLMSKKIFVFFIASLIVLVSLGGQIPVSLAEKNLQPLQEISALDEKSSSDSHERTYFFGCTKFVPTFYCDPILNSFESSAVEAKYTKVLSATREPTFAQGDNGKAVVLTAKALEFITVDNHEIYQTPNFSAFFSLKPGRSDNVPGSLISFTNGEHTAGWKIDLNPTKDLESTSLKLIVFNTDGKAIQTSETIVKANEYSDVLATFDGSNLKIFLNGEIISVTPFEGSYSPDLDSKFPLKFGGAAYCSCDTVTASIDEIRLYNSAISDASAMTVSADNLQSENLVGFWKFNGNLKDDSGFENDAFYNTLISSMGFSSDGRLFYSEKNSGNIRILDSDGSLLSKPFASIPDVYVDWEEGLLGLALDSGFKNNHYVYTYYNYKDELTDEIFARVVRFTDSNNIGSDLKTIFDRISASKGFHTGGAIVNNKSDDKLYIFVGDATLKEKAQDKTVLYGKILRINKDGTIPQDNPFPNSPIYTYGHRNAYGIAFDKDGNGILAESGPETFDEINLIQKGGNYGWPTLQQPNIAPESFIDNSSIKPIRSYFQPPSPAQTIFYENQNYPELQDSFLFATVRGTIFSIKLDPQNKSVQQETKIDLNFYPYKPVIGIASSPSGILYFGAYEIYKIDSINFKDQETMMYPLEIKATNVMVSQIKYSQNDNRLILNLEDESKPSRLSIIIPNLMIKNLENISTSSETTLANDEKTTIRLPHKIQSTVENYSSIITLDIPEDYSKDDNLQFIIHPTELSVTKTIPEFGLTQIILLMSIGIFLVFSKYVKLPSLKKMK